MSRVLFVGGSREPFVESSPIGAVIELIKAELPGVDFLEVQFPAGGFMDNLLDARTCNYFFRQKYEPTLSDVIVIFEGLVYGCFDDAYLNVIFAEYTYECYQNKEVFAAEVVMKIKKKNRFNA